MANKGTDGPAGNFFTRWRKRRRIQREARHLMREARRILRRYNYRIKEEVTGNVNQAIAALKEALAQKQFSVIRDRLEKLDELMERHLAFGRKSAAREYTESIAVAVLVALFLRAFVVEAFKIPSGSMIPTLLVGDHIFVNKFIYGLRIPWTHLKFFEARKPRRGEVIVFVYPKDESKDFIKRIVAVGGDTVAVEKNVVYVNGKPVSHKAITGSCSYSDAEEGNPQWEAKECVAYEEEQDGIRYQVYQHPEMLPMDFKPMKIPEGHVFVMGDNRDNSQDSRFWGTVPDGNIKGKAMVVWWSRGEPDGIRWKRFCHTVH